MSDEPEQGPWIGSLRRIAQELHIDRSVLSGMVRDAQIEAASEERGHPLYRLKDCAELLSVRGRGPVISDGEKEFKSEAERLSWVKAEAALDELKVSRGVLITSTNHERAMSETFKPLSQWLDTLPDSFEAEDGFTPEQVERIQKRLDAGRLVLHDQIVALEIEQAEEAE